MKLKLDRIGKFTSVLLVFNSTPSMEMSPLEGLISAANILRIVVLPDLFIPKIPKHVPRSAIKLIFSTTEAGLNDL